MMGFLRFSALLMIILSFVVYGCMKDVLEPEKIEGLDVVPYYKKGSLEFSTEEALKMAAERKRQAEKKKEEFAKEIKKRVEESGGAAVELQDPWIPPEQRFEEDLPTAIALLPKDYFGYPDWQASVNQGLIKPKAALSKDKESENILDMDILFEINDRLMANVLFSHKVHTYWLDCKNCHPGIFREKKGANQFTMQDVWKGEYCGRCHGKIAFQPKGFENCQRCHSVGKKTMGIQ